MSTESPPHVVAVGVFDGVHRGHQRILARALERARELDVDMAVVTFEPHPDAVLGKAPPRPPLTPVGEKTALLMQLGAARVEVLHFDRELAALEADEFVRRYLLEGLGMRHLVAGADFALGRGRVGTIAYLRQLGERVGFGVDGVSLLLEDGSSVSSSRIRSLLSEGRVREAGELLGRPYDLEAQVVSGRGLGRELGFPTANLELLEHRLLPADGIYAARVQLGDGVWRAGALSIGTRPSIGGGPRTVEVHVLDYEGDLRGVSVRIEFTEWLREERHYPTLEALSNAIAEDVEEVRRLVPEGRRERGTAGSSGGPGGEGRA